MTYDLILDTFVESGPSLRTKDIIKFDMIIKKNGERVGRVTTKDGVTYIRTISEEGVRIETNIKIPYYATVRERDDIIIYLLKKGHVQDDVAQYMGISQSTVSAVKRKYL